MTHLRQSLIAGISVIALAYPAVAIAQEQADAPRTQQASLDDNAIVVTATRREETILDAPLSITAYSQAALDTKGVRSIADLARMTPGLSLNQGTLGIQYIVIRGLTSSIGATMNGVYIDDTPVQVRSLSIATNFYPAIFDLERIEVLRGPQGTLFGAGSMGGAIRYLTTQPSLDEYTGYGRAELGFTKGGDPSYEGGVAVGGPIVQDKIGFRVSGYYRRDGGYIDRIPYADNWGEPEDNHNTRDTYVAQGALTFQPTPEIKVTPSIFYQQQDRNNTDEFWVARPGTEPDPPFPDGLVSGEGVLSFGRDTSILYAVRGEFDVGPMTFFSNTSFTDRDTRQSDDGRAFFRDILGQPQSGGFFEETFGTDFRSRINLNLKQNAFTQEFRVQSNPTGSPFNYVAGIFYQNSRQRAVERDTSPNPAGIFPVFPNINGLIAFGDDFSRDRQFALFGNVDYMLTDKLTVSAGVRYSYLEFDFRQFSGNDLPTDTLTQGRTTESPITPKFGIEYEPREGLLFYANAGKGFRPGGTNAALNLDALDPECADSFAEIGYPDGPPGQYDSDSVWSYEIGAKGQVGSWLTFAADVFQLDWTDVQRSRSILNCGIPFIDNLGESRARGVEGKIVLTPVTGLTLDGNFSYTDATVQQTLVAPGGAGTVVTKGDRFAPEWIISISASYEADLGINDIQGYGRIQWDHRSGYDTPDGNLGFNELNGRIFTRNFVATRVGIRTGGTDLSVFVDNLLNSDDELSRLVLGGGEANRMPVQIYRPRTIGVTASHRF